MGIITDELDWEIMKICWTKRLIDDSTEDKKANYSRKCVIKRKFKLENYKNC